MAFIKTVELVVSEFRSSMVFLPNNENSRVECRRKRHYNDGCMVSVLLENPYTVFSTHSLQQSIQFFSSVLHEQADLWAKHENQAYFL